MDPATSIIDWNEKGAERVIYNSGLCLVTFLRDEAH